MPFSPPAMPDTVALRFGPPSRQQRDVSCASHRLIDHWPLEPTQRRHVMPNFFFLPSARYASSEI